MNTGCFSTRAFRCTSSSGRFTGYIGTAIDITEQRQAAAAQAHLAAIIESADDAIISKDLNGIIQTANATAERVFGYGPGELLGAPVRILIPADRQTEEDHILARIRRGERIEHFETIRVRKDGRLIDISLTVSPIKDASGAIVGVSKIARTSPRKRRQRPRSPRSRRGSGSPWPASPTPSSPATSAAALCS